MKSKRSIRNLASKTTRKIGARRGAVAVAGALCAVGMTGSRSNAGVYTWAGTAGGTWDTSTANWAGTGTVWGNGTADQAVFESTGIGAVNLAATTLNANKITFAANGYTIQGNTLTLAGTTPTIQTDANGTISSILAGSGGLTKVSAGTLTLSGINSFTGGINVGSSTATGGTILLDYTTNPTVVATSNALTLGGGTYGGGTLYIKGKGTGSTSQTLGNLTVAANSGQNAIVVDKSTGTGTTLTLGNTWTRNSGSFTLFDLSSGGVVISSPTITDNVVLGGASSATFYVKTASVTDFATVSGGSIAALAANSSFATAGTGSLTANYVLANSNTYTLTNFANAGTLRVDTTAGNGGILDVGNNTLTMQKNVLLFDGTGNYSVNGTTTGVLRGAGALVLAQFGTGTVTINAKTFGTITKTGTGLLVANNASSIGTDQVNIFNGVYRAASANGLPGSGASQGNIVLNTGGILELTSASGDITRSLNTTLTTTGISFLGDGGFSAFDANRVVAFGGTLSPTSVAWGTTAGFLPDGSKLILGSAYSGFTVDLQNAIDLGASQRIVQVNDGTSTTNVDGKLSGVISGAGGGLVKAGSGTLQLTKINTYTGRTTVTGGVMQVDGSLAAGSAVTIGGSSAAGAPTLTGVGTVNGSVSLASAGGGAAGIINPGTVGTIGTLTTGGVTFNSGSTFAVDLNSTTSDKLAINGTPVVNSGALISFTGSTGATATTGVGKYILATATGGTALATGAFTGTAPTNYRILGTGTELDLTHQATQSFTNSTTTPQNAFVNQTISLTGALSNIAPSNSSNLAVSLTGSVAGTGTLAVTSLASSGGNSLTAQAAASNITGNILTGNTAGTSLVWTGSNTDTNATNGTASITGTVNVFNHGTPTLGSVPVTFGRLTQSTFAGTGSTSTANFTVSNGTIGSPVANTAGLTYTTAAVSGGISITSNGASSAGVVASGFGSTYAGTLSRNAVAGAQTATQVYTFADDTSILGNGSLGTKTVTFSGQVDAIAEHVTTITVTGNSATTSTADFRNSGSGALGSVTVTKTGSGNYLPGYLDNINGGAGVTSGTVQVAVSPSTSSFSGDPSIFLLDFANIALASQLTSLETDLAKFNYTYYDRFGNFGTFNGSTETTGTDPNITGELLKFTHKGYDLELVLNGTGSTNPTYFDFNFGNSAYNGGSGLTVQNLAVVPEPTSVGVIAVGAVGLLSRRRRRRA